MKRPRLPRRRPRPDLQALDRFLHGDDDDTIVITRTDPAGRYVTAPVGPAPRRTRYDRPGYTMTVNHDAPAIPNERVRKAHLSLQLAAEDLAAQGMLYRVDDAEQARQRGEELDERSVIALTVAKAVRHLMGPREPWEPAGWDHGVGTQPQAPAGPVVDVPWRDAYERELGGDAA